MRAILMLAMLLIAAPAAAQTVTLDTGEMLVLVPAADGTLEPGERGPAELRDFDANFLAQLRDSYATGEEFIVGTPSSGDRPTPIAESALAIRFVVVDGKEAVLILENGFPGGVTYRARMELDGEWRETDVCLVMPGRRGYEHWPHRIDRIELREIEFVPWESGDPIPCR